MGACVCYMFGCDMLPYLYIFGYFDLDCIKFLIGAAILYPGFTDISGLWKVPFNTKGMNAPLTMSRSH